MTSDDLQRLSWRTSSRTGNTGNCVEVAGSAEGARYVRDTKDRRGPMLAFGPGQWERFLSYLKANDQDS